MKEAEQQIKELKADRDSWKSKYELAEKAIAELSSTKNQTCINIALNTETKPSVASENTHDISSKKVSMEDLDNLKSEILSSLDRKFSEHS